MVFPGTTAAGLFASLCGKGEEEGEAKRKGAGFELQEEGRGQ
ncbi:unnamed protein product [Victoria cruziana]